MNKIIALTLVAGSVAATSALGQGYLQLQSGKSAVYDSFTTLNSGVLDTKVDVALLVSTSSTAAPSVEALFTGTATSGQLTSTQAQTAWTDITSDPNFTQAIDETVNPGGFVVYATSTKGVAQFNGGSTFGIQNSSTANTVGTSSVLSFYEVSWNGSLFSTLAAAAAANGALGWSAVQNGVSMNVQSSQTQSDPQFASFGTLGVVAVPEPTTLALAGLGGLSLLAFRRKK